MPDETTTQPEEVVKPKKERKKKEKPDKQADNRNPDGTFKDGISGNLNGRPKGKTLKEWASEYFTLLTDKERVEFFNKLDPALVWRMAEGNPAQSTDLTSKGEKILVMPVELMQKNESNPQPSDNSEGSSQV